jgi:hypothetical protein
MVQDRLSYRLRFSYATYLLNAISKRCTKGVRKGGRVACVPVGVASNKWTSCSSQEDIGELLGQIGLVHLLPHTDR